MAAVVTKESQGLRDERGQAFVLVVASLVVLLGMAALGIDVGSWYKAQRHDQAVADAAALAGSQALPDDPAQAQSLALDYANRNGVTLNAGDITFASHVSANDTIRVSFSKPESTIFAKVFGIGSVQVGARAVARAGLPGAARYVAPIVVPITNPMFQCTPPPCTDPTQIVLDNLHNPGSGNAAGSFALLDLIPNDNGSVGSGILADWMLNGNDDDMPLGIYEAVPSTKYNSSAFQDALKAKVGDDVLFPVYQPPILLGGSNAQFNIIGWVAFHIDSQGAKGSSGALNGHFTTFLAQGLQAAPGTGTNTGVKVVQLVE
jgi:putative Flp pilus-assembly TadE/G-like protein